MNVENIKKNLFDNGLDFPDMNPGLARPVILFLPGLLFLLTAIALAIPATRAATIWMLLENGPVEVITFLVLTIGGLYGLNLSWKLHRKGEHIGYVLFYAVFSLGILFTGLEEIAWGQQFWGFETPGAFKELNMQGETTLHNLPGFHGHTEVFRLLFGVGGLIGILLTKTSRLGKIGAPVILVGFFAVIAAHASIDVFDDIVKVPKFMEAATSKLAELVELLIAAAAFLYLYFNSQLLIGKHR